MVGLRDSPRRSRVVRRPDRHASVRTLIPVWRSGEDGGAEAGEEAEALSVPAPVSDSGPRARDGASGRRRCLPPVGDAGDARAAQPFGLSSRVARRRDPPSPSRRSRVSASATNPPLPPFFRDDGDSAPRRTPTSRAVRVSPMRTLVAAHVNLRWLRSAHRAAGGTFSTGSGSCWEMPRDWQAPTGPSTTGHHRGASGEIAPQFLQVVARRTPPGRTTASTPRGRSPATAPLLLVAADADRALGVDVVEGAPPRRTPTFTPTVSHEGRRVSADTV